MIHETPPLDASLASQLSELDQLRRQIGAETDTPSRWIGNLRRLARARAVESSVSIEGYRISLDQTRAILDRGRGRERDDIAEQAVACYGRAMDHVTVLAGDPSFEWSERLLLDLHFDACYFQFEQRPGRWRSGPMYVKSGPRTVYEAPDADRLPSLIDELIAWLRTGDLEAHTVVRAAMAHLHLVSIHPFRDGNGRVSRLVQSLVLAREGTLAPEFASIEEYLGEHTSAYYAALDEAHGAVYDPSCDARNWVEFCVTAHLAQARRRLRDIKEAARRWNVCEQIAEARHWPDRLVIAMEQSLTGTLTNSTYREEADVTSEVARLDFNRLLDSGLVIPRGKGRATRYVASAALEEQIAPNRSVDPAFLAPRSGPTIRITASPSPGVTKHVESHESTGATR
ncbi:MAG: Fic family protein [Chloroflexota bacterium]